MSDKYILRSGAIDAIKRNSGTLYTREAEFLLQKVIFLLKMLPPPTWWRWYMGSGCIVDMRNAPSGLNS
jgi:hypothetical protein